MIAKAPEAADFMRQFSNANRLMLLCQIAREESSVSDIQEALGIKQPALSQQLAELRQAGLVKTRRESRQIYYSIADGRAEAVMGLLFELFCGSEAPSAAGLTERRDGAPAPDIRGDAAHFARIVISE
ncbi:MULTISPECIES: ArsR/SmtB family transcription factor [unclassified Shinella]|uniref:ArsR/SmtB family transcription factor n=1 Tax=unclassified Shinella TaxID=2643062 RepID=UPI001FDAB28E|nr:MULTISPECIES: metalloregulator ArsR/SmtB family transcription factor [unclassified Shinella]MCA0339004.1 metalloregulator ArsR/SmtB family transcription factor [Pseudomonadota bacterium]MCO5148800.1 metalloregulator ArsR/SmtB family transcription factor [Shinella sp.]MDG4676058.1 metalloregulator ArsR/SmtB family transcription factor [Shinella sp. 838]